jgi:probable rRNA maturation factor
MEVVFSSECGEGYEWLGSHYAKLAETAFAELGVKGPWEIDVSLVSAETIQEINRSYRHIDRVTDVISFAFADDKNPKDRIKGSQAPKLLGEILICLPQARKQAEEIGHSERRELSFLFVHGLLHLLGYDHATKEGEDIMFPLQEKILGKAGE